MTAPATTCVRSRPGRGLLRRPGGGTGPVARPPRRGLKARGRRRCVGSRCGVGRPGPVSGTRFSTRLRMPVPGFDLTFCAPKWVSDLGRCPITAWHGRCARRPPRRPRPRRSVPVRSPGPRGDGRVRMLQGHVRASRCSRARARERVLEIVSVLMLSARERRHCLEWLPSCEMVGGSGQRYTQASTARSLANRASTLAALDRTQDLLNFNRWLELAKQGRTDLAAFTSAVPAEFRPAFGRGSRAILSITSTPWRRRCASRSTDWRTGRRRPL